MIYVFADAAYWIATVNPRDQLHRKARAIRTTLGSFRVVTSEWVFTEMLNHFAERGPEMRVAASKLIKALLTSAEVVVVPQTNDDFRAAFDLYCQRPDKAWSLTDCASFQIMQRYGIESSLTYDRHFEQAGFKALLR